MQLLQTHWQAIPPGARTVAVAGGSFAVGLIVAGWTAWRVVDPGEADLAQLTTLAALIVVYGSCCWLSVAGLLRHVRAAQRVDGPYVVCYSGLIWAIATWSSAVAFLTYLSAADRGHALLSSDFARGYLMRALILLPFVLAAAHRWRREVHRAIGAAEDDDAPA